MVTIPAPSQSDNGIELNNSERFNDHYQRQFRNAPTTMVPRPAPFPQGEVNPSRTQAVQVPDIEQVPARYIALALTRLHEHLGNLATMIKDHSRLVDNYQPQMPLSGESELTFSLQPQWEGSEIIESIIITGPPAGVFTLQLGDRVWPLVMPAAGILPITNIALLLNRDDNRILTATAPGNYSLELMGHYT